MQLQICRSIRLCCTAVHVSRISSVLVWVITWDLMTARKISLCSLHCVLLPVSHMKATYKFTVIFSWVYKILHFILKFDLTELGLGFWWCRYQVTVVFESEFVRGPAVLCTYGRWGRWLSPKRHKDWPNCKPPPYSSSCCCLLSCLVRILLRQNNKYRC